MSAEDETAKMATEEYVAEYVADYSDEHKIQPYSGTPKKDGVASAGNASTGFACGDHVHPTDTSRLSVETFNTEMSNLRNSFFDNVSYDENLKKILFKNGDTVLKELPATQFIKDGMVSSVAISNEKLVISFNTDAGKEDIQIPLTDIFNPSNYYDKTAADGRFVQKEAGKGLVAVDAKLTTPGDAADAKAVGDALRTGFTEWECDSISEGWTFVSCEWISDPPEGLEAGWVATVRNGPFLSSNVFLGSDASSVSLSNSESFPALSLSRHHVTPTKTSQLENDGDGTHAFVKSNDTRLSNARTPTAHTHAMADVTGLNTALGQKASLTDLPYRLVEPGKWEFSDGQSHTISAPYEDYGIGGWVYELDGQGYESIEVFSTEADALAALSLTFATTEEGTITATRASLPGHLCDRAGNRVVVSGDTTLTLPAANPGYLRDFLVRLEISGSTVPTITFAAPTGETITYETDGDEFPVPDEAGTWSYSFTENCVAHKFAVSLKKVNTVAAPQVQGGA